MTRRCLRVVSYTSLIVVSGMVDAKVPLRAQEPNDRGLPWAVTLQKCRQTAQSPCVFYGDQAAIEMKFGISNLGLQGIRLPALAEYAIIRVAREAKEIETISDWHVSGEQTVAGSHLNASDVARRDLLLGVGDSARSSLTLRLANGSVFTAGNYVLTVDLQRALENSTLDSGSRWQGRSARAQTWNFVIRQPSIAEDWMNYHELEASYLLGQRKTKDALFHLEEWLRVSPGNRLAVTALGQAYLELDRPIDAIKVLEPVLPTVLQEREERHRHAFAVLLARSYVRLNDENNARRVLRLTGDSERTIDATIERIRRR